MIPKPDSCRTCKLWSVTHFERGRLVKNDGTGWVNPWGTPRLGVTFVGEAAGAKEEIAGLPFRSDAQAGSILERVFRRIGVDRSQVAIGNVLSCRPPNNELSGKSYEQAAIEHCAVHRDNFIQTSRMSAGANPNVKTHITVALGDTAFSTLTGLSGDKVSISRTRGYPIHTPAYGWVMGTYHPAFVARKRKFFGVLLEDILKAFDWARDGFTPFPTDYTTDPTPADIDAFVRRVLADPSLTVSWDIETAFEPRLDVHRGQFPDLKSVQFSMAPGTGIFLDATPENREAIKLVMASPNIKIGHNVWDFDCHITKHFGVTLNGVMHDSLWMFHHYQPDITIEDAAGDIDADDDLRLSTSAGLQYVASFCGMDFIWKDQAIAQPKWYGIADVDACSRIWATLPQKMKNLGVWDGYERHVRRMKPILDGAANRGMWFDLDGRDKLHDELQLITIKLDDVMQKHHPDHLKRLEPPDGYATGPRVSDKIRWEPYDPCGATLMFGGKPEPGRGFGDWMWLDDSQVDEDAPEEEVIEGAPKGVWRPMVRLPFRVTKKELVKPCECGVAQPVEPKLKKDGTLAAKQPKPEVLFMANCPTCSGAGKYFKLSNVVEERWARRLPFKPSNKQLIKYIQFKGHKVPHDRKSGKDTTNREKIAELAHKTKDPIYQTILDIRTVTKMDSTYVTGRWIPTRTWEEYYDDCKRRVGLIQTHFTTAPATGQKSSRDPNIQNAPKHVRNANLRDLNLPKRFRKLLVAPPNHKIVEFDFKSFHALTLGFEAKCLDYMRLARIDVHTFMTSMMLFKRGVIKAPIDLNVGDSDLKLALKDMRASLYTKMGGSWQRVTKDMVKSYDPRVFVSAKEVRDTQAKPAILGYGFGMQGLKLFETNKDSFANAIEAQAVLDLIDEAFPPLKKYRDATAMLAHNQHYIVTRFGFVRWFWDVFSFKYNPNLAEKWVTSHGSDYEDAIALGPSNDAFGHIDEAMITLDEQGWLERGKFVNTVHDSLIFYLHNDIFDNAMGSIKEVMEAPSKVLINDVAPGGLSVEVEVAAGPDWGSLQEVA